jgi:hypothetical protein
MHAGFMQSLRESICYGLWIPQHSSASMKIHNSEKLTYVLSFGLGKKKNNNIYI